MKFSKNSALQVSVAVFSLVAILFGVSYTTKAVEVGPDWAGGAVTLTLVGDHVWHDGDQHLLTANIPTENITAKVNDGSFATPRLTDRTYFVYPTSAGYFNGYYALPTGESRWQTIDRAGYTNAGFYGNPAGSGTLVFVNGAGSSAGQSSLRYVSDWRVMFGNIAANYQGNVIRHISTGFDITTMPVLKKLDGSILPINTKAAPSYSRNGQWVYLNSDIGQLRAHIPDLSYTILGPRITDTYAIYSAVSGDGRFAVAGSKNSKLTLYDTANCDLTSCVKKELYTGARAEYLKTLPSGVTLGTFDVVGVKFVSAAKLEAYFWLARSDGVSKYIKAYIGVDAGVQPTRYLALGDSFSSGEGAGSYYEATNFYAGADDYNFCHQSRVAYSELLNSWFKPDYYDSVACSGAQMKDVIYEGAENDYIKYAPSQSRKPADDGVTIQLAKQSNLPGYIPQLSLLQENLPSVVTISIGGNDIGFKDVIMACVANIECYRSRDEREKLADLITSKTDKLTATFRNIKNNMSGDIPRLYVTGYPQLFAESACGSFMSVEEQEFANRLVDYLNEIINIASHRAGAMYVDVSRAFIDDATNEDHRLCGNSFQAANGVFFDANNMPDMPFLDALSRALVSSYHPNELGHQLLAQTIREQTNSFEKIASDQDAVEESQFMTYYSQLVGDSNDNLKELADVSENITKDIVVEGGQSINILYTLGVDDNGLPVKDATVTVVAQSTPLSLGVLTVQSDNTLSGNFILPKSLESGVHTIHLLYTDISGQKHDIYQYIFVAASSADIDGDGIPNDEEVCLIGGTMGIDRDQDGLDDACDPEFTKPTAAQTNETNDSRILNSDRVAIADSQGGSSDSPTPKHDTEEALGASTFFGALARTDGVDISSDTRNANPVEEAMASSTLQRSGIIQYIAPIVAFLVAAITVTMYFAKRKRF